MRLFSIFISLVLLTVAEKAACQETVFSLLSNNLKKADKHFNNKNYLDALSLYQSIAKRKSSRDLDLKIARSYHFLKNYKQAIAVYEKYAIENKLPSTDLYYYAEAQSGISNYDKAIKSHQDYLERVPEDPLIIKKIWRLNNIQYLYEDSLHYAVRPIHVNTTEGELCAVPYQNGLVFISNRKQVQVIEETDGSRHAPFYRIYYAKGVTDTTARESLEYGSVILFDKGLTSRFHVGAPSFYDRQTKLIFASTENKAGRDGRRTLQLYFAEKGDEGWRITSKFPFNSSPHSISHPTISEDGKILYFSSDMGGGMGGKDIYKSEFMNGQWSKPKNLGEPVNTTQDEVFPYLHQHTLYFSSNGHAGLGGLDLFKSEITPGGYDEPQNVGYPLNTSYDDFGITIDSASTHGYFSSNRSKGGYNDDIYEFDMDFQTYPLEINGVMRFKEHGLADSLELKVMANARIFLIDNTRNVTVHESTSDINGNFSMIVPYLSKYKIRVVGEENDENIVSLEIPKHRKEDSKHEIVIVKDLFKSH
jgi:hypothetical protein